MGDPRDIWIHVANIALGVAVLALLLATIASAAFEIASHIGKRIRLRAELDRDLRDFAQMFSHR